MFLLKFIPDVFLIWGLQIVSFIGTMLYFFFLTSNNPFTNLRK